MVAALSSASLPEASPDSRLTAGAMLTIATAERTAKRITGDAPAPSHLLYAILERPGKRVRDFLVERGISIGWMTNAIQAGLLQQPDLRGPELETLIARAADLAATNGESRVDDFALFQALIQGGDALTEQLFHESGLRPVRRPMQLPEAPVANVPTSPRIALPPPTPIGVSSTSRKPVHSSLFRQELHSLIRSTRVSVLFIAMVGIALLCAIGLTIDQSAASQRGLTAVFLIMTWMISLCMHEYGHAAAAFMNGDWGVKGRGYLSFDPRAYTNPLLSFGLPVVMLLLGGLPFPGGAVLLDSSAFRTPEARRTVAICGPAANFVCALILTLPIVLGLDTRSALGTALCTAAMIQVMAIVLNMLPIPMLDGWNFYTAGASHEKRARGAALGWYPFFGLFMAMRFFPPVNYVFWIIVFFFSYFFRIDLTAAIDGLEALSLW